MNEQTNPAADNVVDITARIEDDHLAREHGLVKTTAYVKDPDSAKKKTGAADRMKRMRERKKEAGLASAEVPAAVAEAIREQGFEAWLDSQRAAPPREVERVVEVEKPVEIVREVLKIERVEVPVPGPERVIERVIEVPAPLPPGLRGRLIRWLMG